MFHLLQNVKKRNIVTDLSIEAFIDAMKNPDFIRKSQVDGARALNKADDEYRKIKETLPCLVFNFTHDGYVKGSTATAPTGYVFIDIDNTEKIDLSQYPYVVAAWSSLSNKGMGVLVKADGVTTKNYKEVTNQISKELGVKNDDKAISIDRLCVLGYDNDIYYNPNSTTYTFTNTYFKSNSTELVQFNPIINYTNKVALDCTNKRFRYSNLEELIGDIDFKGELFIDLGENKVKYAEVVIPKVINDGSRNVIMFAIVSQVFGLNTWVTEDTLLNWAMVINKDKFRPELDEQELRNIVRKVHCKELPPIILNKSKRFLFNPDYDLTGAKKRSLATSYRNKQEGIKNTNRIIGIIQNWDFEEHGRISQSKLANISGMSIRTIKNKYKIIKEVVDLINEDYEKSL